MSERYVVILTLYALASFGATLVLAEAILWLLRAPILRGVGRLRPSDGILAHAVLRFLPAMVALILTLLSAIPGYLRGEPMATNETPGLALVLLALIGIGTVLLPIFSAVRRIRQTRAKVREWSRTATGLGEFSQLPMIELDLAKPLVVASGLLHSSILLSRPVRSLLSARELRAALRHEVAHCRKHHNLLKLLCALAPHLLGTQAMDESLCELLEFDADDAACSVAGDGLNLASAVVILARENSALRSPALYSALTEACSPVTLERRVQRLVRPSGATVQSRLAQLASTSTAVLAIIAIIGSLPVAQHAFRETLEMLVH